MSINKRRAAVGRGREFESAVAELLRLQQFEVSVNPGAARPRQTDLYAKSGDVGLLVEVKNRKKKIDVSDIENLRLRVARTPSDVVAALFTISDLTVEAIKLIEADRTREILVFSAQEFKLAQSGRVNLHTLIDRKRTELRVQGRVWFQPPFQSEFVHVPLPIGDCEFRTGDLLRPLFSYGLSRGSVTYALQIPDPGWGSYGYEGVVLQLQLTLTTLDDLQNILGYLHEKLGLSERGVFSIHQTSTTWQGSGVANFLLAAQHWRERYLNLRRQHFHNTEDLKYFDQLRSGRLALSLRQRVGWEPNEGSFFLGSELAIQLPGVPVDTKPFLDLCRYTGNLWAEFRPIASRLTHTVRFKSPLELKANGFAVERSNQLAGSGKKFICGVVASNPFSGKKALPRELLRDELPLHDLLNAEVLLCSLRDWHSEEDQVDRYLLEGIEVADACCAIIIRPFGTWGKIKGRE